MPDKSPNDDICITKRKTPPYWWPDINVVLQLILAISIVLMVAFILHQLLDGKFNLEQAQRDLLMVLLGVILACFKDVFGYTFGSSAGQKRQGEVITQSLHDKDKIIAENVVATAALAAGNPSVDALKAAAAVAPAAAAVAAPPAADIAAPPAAREAVADAMAAQAEAESHKPKE